VKAVDAASTFLLAVAWVAVAAVVSIGAAGVVASMNHFPATPARAELTWRDDQVAGPALDAATVQLQNLSDEVDTLGLTAREALTQVVAGDLDTLNGTIAAGSGQVDTVKSAATSLKQALAGIPGAGDDRELRLSSALLARYDALIDTADLTGGLEVAWAGFAGRALDAAGLTGLLASHDSETADAAGQGSAAHYRRALTLLEKSDATIARARSLRDRLARTTDVSTLSQWLDRSAAYDRALRTLYTAMIDSNGRVTDRVRRAFQGEQAARAQLPADTRSLVVIMNDVAQGGLNQAVISIEQARGALTAALDAQRKLQGAPDQPQ
jgi:hypothetical protein